jgi:N-acetylmuramoyl-L-alanine amidase
VILAVLALTGALAGATLDGTDPARAERGDVTPHGGAPRNVTVSTPRGDLRIPVHTDAAGTPVLSAPVLLAALDGTVRVAGNWAEVSLARQGFRFLVGAPVFTFNDRLQVLAAPVLITHDTLFLPLQFVTEFLPTFLSERYRYEKKTGRLTVHPVRGAAPPVAARRLPNGLRPGHLVTVDAGHGGVDPGNPGMFFPGGLKEKDVTLQVSLLLRDELRRRGVGVRMTRTTDTLIALGDRGGYCAQSCDLFLSIHVNSLPRKRSNFTSIRGFETYFLAEARTEDAARVARMENDAVRFETAGEEVTPLGGVDFIVKDLQLNEHLRESARLAELVQDGLGRVHTGPDLGVRQAGFMVLTTARRPAILVELGYSTNPDDSKLMTASTGQRRLASALADAVVDYLLEYERKTDAAADSGVARQ